MNLEHLLLALNIAVVILFTIAYIPQIITTYKTTDHTGVSSFFWMLISVSTTLTLYNVLLTGNASWYVYLGQFINAIVATIIFIWLFSTFEEGLYYKALIVLLYAMFIVYATYFFEITGIQIAATITIILAYIDQIKHFIRKKNSQGTNPWLYILFTIGLSCLVIIFMLTDVSYYVIATECVNIVLLLTCAYLSHKYKKKNKM